MEAFKIGGEAGKRLRRVKDGFLIGYIDANPAIVEQYFQRDTQPQMKIQPWSGEFCGKYLCSCAAVYRLEPDPTVRAECERLIGLLGLVQDDDGYLGPFPKNQRLIGRVHYDNDCMCPHWDIWGHYHTTVGLLEWYELTGNARYLDSARKIAALVARFIEENDITNDEHLETKAAYLHAFAKLYTLTGEKQYLDDCATMLKIFEKNGRFLENLEADKEFYQSDFPRWETLHFFEGIAELYKSTRNARYLSALRRLYRSIKENDIHNTGAFSSGEQASGNAYTFDSIETCCTVAWLQVLYGLYDITGDAEIIETIEKAYYNTVMGSIHPSGKWSTYNTPMKGERLANHQDISFQSAACTDVNCCSVNAPRALGGIHRWGFVEKEGCVTVNWLSECAYTDGKGTTIDIQSQYPYGGTIRLDIRSEAKKPFRIRLPKHADTLTVTVDGKAVEVCGKDYLEIESARTTVEMNAAFSVRAVKGEKDLGDLYSLYYGPLLLAYDRRFNTPYTDVPTVALHNLQKTRPQNPLHAPNFLVKAGETVLCDFDYAGCNGTRYTTWVKLADK